MVLADVMLKFTPPRSACAGMTVDVGLLAVLVSRYYISGISCLLRYTEILVLSYCLLEYDFILAGVFGVIHRFISGHHESFWSESIYAVNGNADTYAYR